MRITFLGHSCFHLALEDGTSILIDPYEPGGLGGRLTFLPLEMSPDIVLITHEHPDHSDLSWIGGDPEIIRVALDRPGLTIKAHQAAHDEFGGKLRGGHVRLFSIRADTVHVLHCSDLGERLQPRRVRSFGAVDALLVPIGGYYTLGPEGAAELVRAIAPRYAVPCHYRSSRTKLDELAPLSAFTRRFERSRWPGRLADPANDLDPSIAPQVSPTVVCLNPLGAVS